MLSLSPLTVLPCSPLEQIEAAHAAGFDAVGLRLIPGMDSDIDVMGDAGLRRAIAARLQATGLKVLDIEVVRLGPAWDTRALRSMFEYAADLGAKTLAVTALSRGEDPGHTEEQMVEKLSELCALADRSGIQPMLEFMVYRRVANLEDAVRIVRKVGHPAMGICVDALHLARSGGSPSEVTALDPSILRCVQLCDAPLVAPAPEDLPREARSGRLFPGEGGLPLRELIAATPHGVPMSVEVPTSTRSEYSVLELALKAAASVRKLLESARA
jgi:sugar phosphate isomerase/epimerase